LNIAELPFTINKKLKKVAYIRSTSWWLCTAHVCRTCYYSYFNYSLREFCAILLPRLVLKETTSVPIMAVLDDPAGVSYIMQLRCGAVPID